MNKLYEYLDQIRPLVKATAIEKMAGLPTGALGKHYSWRDGNPSGQAIKLHHVPAIFKALASTFGAVTYQDYLIMCFPENVLVTYRETAPVQVTQTTNGFEYNTIQEREVWDDDDFQTLISQLEHEQRAENTKVQ